MPRWICTACGTQFPDAQAPPAVCPIGTEPAFAIGERPILARTPAGNVLWDCMAWLDAPYRFDRLYAGWFGLELAGGADRAVQESADRYLAKLAGHVTVAPGVEGSTSQG